MSFFSFHDFLTILGQLIHLNCRQTLNYWHYITFILQSETVGS